MKIKEAVMQYKTYFVIAIAVLAVLAYAIPYGMDVEAKGPPSNPGNGQGQGYGLSCDHFVAKIGPVRCR